MPVFTTVILVILLSAILFLAIWLFYQFIMRDYILPFLDHMAVSKGLTKEQRNILHEARFHYYIELSPSKKREFEKRLKFFIHNKEFIGKNLPEVTEEMKVLVGASAVQLTFGYAPIKFAHFPKIVLFPGPFYSKGSDKLKRGEVNMNGLIVLSWKDFIRDYKIYNDGFNLGLHEMAHALKLEHFQSGNEYALLRAEDLDNFYSASKEEYMKLRKGKKSFIRSYAGTNTEEFFAVAVEQFFEQPRQFKQKLPGIYDSLCKLLNQDPTKLG